MTAVCVISAVAAGVIAGGGPARAGIPAARPATTSYSVTGELHDVAATGAANAWAVGHAGEPNQLERTLLAHWNGKAWAQVTSPKPVFGALQGIAAASATNAWAVGGAGKGIEMGLGNSTGSYVPLILHWNGRQWSRLAGVPKVDGWLNAVAVWGSSVWAVGETAGQGGHGTALILHETGGRWYVVPNGSPVSSALWTVAVTGAGAAWAGGAGGASYTTPWSTVLLRWNGAFWKAVSSPIGKTPYSDVTRVAAGPRGTAWAVGYYDNNSIGNDGPLSMSWNGKAWAPVPVPVPIAALEAVTFVPGGGAWAIGDGSDGVVAFRWTGRAWLRVTTPAIMGTVAVAATSPGNAWAVGYEFLSPPPGASYLPTKTVIAHWNGRAWS